MTTARDVIANVLYLHDRNMLDHEESDSVADQVLAAILSAPESVRMELAGKLNPWRPIETAPKNDDAPYTMGIRKGAKIPGIIGWDDGWYWLNGMFTSPCEPTHYLPLPAPPSEDK